VRSQRHRLEETLIDHITADVSGDLITDSEAELLARPAAVETLIEGGGSLPPRGDAPATTWNG
jgi:hypothetical protein